MKKSLCKFMTLVFAALGLSLGAFAVGNDGDVISIQAVPLNGAWETPKNVGETFYILVRLMNQRCEEMLEPDADISKYEWVFQRNGESVIKGDWSDEFDPYRPALRIAIGAKKVNATLALAGPNYEPNGLNPDNNFYTDFYFSYTVKEGELGQPVRFVNGDNKIVDTPEGVGSRGLALVNVKTELNKIGFYDLTNGLLDEEGKSALANFSYWTGSLPLPSKRPYPGPDTDPRQNYDMVYAGEAAGKAIGISVKTIDFGPAEEEAKKKDAWRLIEQNGGAQGVEPQITGQGPTTVYVWSDNEAAVVPEGEIEPTDDGRTVVKVQLNGDGTPTSFALKGQADAEVGDSAWICLCSQPTPAKNWQDNVIAGSYLSNRVEIVKSVARLSITDETGGQSPRIEATTNELAYLTMKLTLNKPFEKKFEVNLNPTVVGHPEIDALTNRYVVVLGEKDVDPTVQTASITNLTLEAGQTTAYFFVYALGSCAELSDSTGGLKFTPTVNETLYPEAYDFFKDGTPIAATVKVTDQKPTASVSAETEAFEGDPVEVEVEVQDNWRDLSSLNTNSYTVAIRLDSEEIVRTNVAFAAESSKSFTFTAPKTKNARDEEKTLTVRVWDGTHGTGNNAAFTWAGPFTLRAQPTYRAYARLCYPGTSTAIDPNHLFCEGDSAQLSFAVEDANGKPIGAPRNMYAMLVPLDAMSSNLVDAAVLTKRFDFAAEATNSQQSVVITLLDGDALRVPATVANFRFDLYDAADNKPISEAVVKHVTVPQLTVTNAAPTVVSVRKGSYDDPEATVEPNVLYEKSRVPSGVGAMFSLKVSDLGEHDLYPTNAADRIRVRVEWTDGPEGDKWTDRDVYTVNSNGVAEVIIPFLTAESVQTVSFYVMDKDQKAVAQNVNDFGDVPAFTFTVKVAKMPNVYVQLPAGNTNGYYNESTDYSEAADNPAFRVRLTEFPKQSDFYRGEDPVTGATIRDTPISETNPLVVRVTHGDFDDNGCVDFHTNLLYFATLGDTQAGLPVYFNRATQNGGGVKSMTIVTVEVLNKDRKADGTPWSKYFGKTSQKIFILNDNPATMKLSAADTSVIFRPNATNTWTAGETVKLKWTVGDIARDVTNGYFTIFLDGIVTDHGDSTIRLPVTQVLDGTSKPLKATASGEFSFVVPGESTEVTVTADDNEEGSLATKFWIRIVPTKKLSVNPFGPAPSTQTKYRTAAGLGRGHVYVEDSNGSYIARQFEQTWSFNESKKEASLFGAGYPASKGPAYDDGTLGVADGYKTGAALSPTGAKWESGSYYNYGESDYDNFFYVWAQIGGAESGGGITYFNPQPTKTPREVAKHKFTLDNEKEKDSEASYGTIEVEAVFAQEKYPADNLGDINQDGIPDLYLLKSWANGMLGGIFSADGALAGNDLTKVNTLNDDADYLPAMGTSLYGALIPGLEGTWVTEGKPFKAITEIRGYHEGLNNAPELSGIKGVKPDRIYEVTNEVGEAYYNPTNCTISELEYLAWCDAGKDPKWSPERPTDPTTADTDEDGFPDGYEYFMWYRAHVGYMEGTNHVYQTGRRYNPIHPAEPEIIPSQTIEALFDPLTPHEDPTRDTDNDGIPDLIEFEIGTNPADFDTDGDGLPDGYEVMIGTNPYDDIHRDSLDNPDGDIMAFQISRNYHVYGFLVNGKVIYRAVKREVVDGLGAKDAHRDGELKVEYGSPEGGYWQVLIPGSGNTTNTYLTTVNLTGKFRTDADGIIRLSVDLPTEKTWKLAGKNKEGNPIKGLPAFICRGNLLIEDPTEVEVVTRKVNVSYAYNYPRPRRAFSAFRYGFPVDPSRDNRPFSYFAIGGDAEMRPDWPLVYQYSEDEKDEPVYLMHDLLYQEAGFHPQTACALKGTDSRGFLNYDEFLAHAWQYHANLRDFESKVAVPGLYERFLGVTEARPWPTIWGEFTTDPHMADTDGDGMPDGWEYYVMTGGLQPLPKEISETTQQGFVTAMATSEHGPLQMDDANLSGDSFRENFSAVETVKPYEGSETISNVYPEWRNKKWATDPWNSDTDGDGIPDAQERTAFAYDPEGTEPSGGGLNPLSWDTDLDGLPDPWELEFAGHLVEGEASTVTETTVDEATGATNTVTRVTRAAGSWEGGMDGTVADQHLDYDYDGLQNWQEYIAGTLRCWRYDDTCSPWESLHGYTVPEVYDDKWAEGWFDGVLNEWASTYNPNFMAGMFDNGAPYLSLCKNGWDPACGRWYYFRDGVDHDLSNPPPRYSVKVDQETFHYNRFTWPWRDDNGDYGTYKVQEIMNRAPKFGYSPDETPFDVGTDPNHIIYPKKYISCDPSNPDTDNDGMDDFYEMFHGMNPLLGAKDIIWEAYGGGISWSALNNYWNNVVDPHAAGIPSGPTAGSVMNFITCPWLNGLPTADPDGDDIRNQQEAIMGNIQAASTYMHTDPTPLWMTDISYARSLTRTYFVAEYAPRAASNQSPLSYGIFPMQFPGDGFWIDLDCDGEDEFHPFSEFYLAWDSNKLTLTPTPYNYNYWEANSAYTIAATVNVRKYFYSFEMNEGYDTDHDFLGDREEAQGLTKPASDPQDADSPRRRQAMYFDGVDSFLTHPLVTDEVQPKDDAKGDDGQPYLYYTVECWAKAEEPDSDRFQTLVERAILNGDSQLADQRFLRKNFLIGIRGGRWYAKYDSTGTSEGGVVEITDGPVATTNWTHVASTYDGHYLRLFVDGVERGQQKSGLQPEHAVKYILVDEKLVPSESGDNYAGLALPSVGLAYVPATFVVGASAATSQGVMIDFNWRIDPSSPSTTTDDFGDFFKGYIDEVRVWDGARAEKDINADWKNRVRYTRETALANRDEVYLAWQTGGRRLGPTDTTRSDLAELPAQLMHHWAFDHLPGATTADWAIKAATGFSANRLVTDSRAPWSRPDGWVNPWWGEKLSALHSRVYTDYALVPWIVDTVSHLPRLDQTTLDSIYWSEDYAGNASAVSFGFTRFAFPRSAEPYGCWHQLVYGKDDAKFIYSDPTRYTVISGDEAAKSAMQFTLRHSHTSGDDLLPMGHAFARRISAAEGGMWDEQGPADAWAQTGADNNLDNLPDWWAQYARIHYGSNLKPRQSVTWSTTVSYFGQLIPAWRAYLLDLARGMLPDTRYHDEYADVCDLDGDKMPDWWEDLYSVQGNSSTDGSADPDHDGLSNFAEWKISEDAKSGFGTANGYPIVNPALAHSKSDQIETDYFLRMADGDKAGRFKGMYLGEIVADHDFMEDDLEGDFGTDRTLYDAWSDYDEDGWSAWAELRYSTFKMTRAARFVSHIVGDEEVKDFPIPVVHATLRYNGAKTLAGSNATIVVEAYSGNNLQKSPNAFYSIKPGATETRQLYLGAFEDRVVHGTLTPGFAKAGLDLVSLQCAMVQDNDTFSWTISTGEGETSSPQTGTYQEMLAAFRRYGTDMTVSTQEFSWEDVPSPTGEKALQVTINEKKQRGYILFAHERIGEIDFTTGDFTLDLGKLKGYYMGDTNVALEQCVFRMEYTVSVPTLQTKALSVSLANPDAGNLTEGTTAFVAYMDLDGDGFTPGTDPIGFAKGVEIGWDRVPELTIEMTDGSQACGAAFAYDDDVDMLRVVRTSINGNGAGVKHRIVFSRNHELTTTTTRRNVHDGDYLTSGTFGLDWANLASDIAMMDGISESDVTQVGYTVVRGKGSIVNIPEDSIVTTFTVPYSATRTAPAPYSPSVSAMPIVETQRPTFRWSVPEGYTAFRLQISDAAGKQVYVSDLQKMPPRDASARYFWTPPVYIGTVVSTNGSWQIANNSNYTWRVAVYNPKFRTTEWSEPAAFSTALAEDNDFTTQYGSATVTVGYFGPATNDLGNVIVQLYRTADFTGVPMAQTRLFAVDGKVGSLTNVQTVAFHGLPSGDYYACAFIDRNGDSVRQRYESWGYAANVGLGLAAIWTPREVKVDAENAAIPSAEVFIEDTDVNQNDIPDCLDDESILKSADTEIETTTATDTDGDGMPDKWEEENGLNPYDPSDAENAIDGDMMAYLDLDVCLVHIGKPDNSGSAWYALPDYRSEPSLVPGSLETKKGYFQPQTPATNLFHVVSTWKNGSAYGLGTNVTFAAADGLVVLDSKLGTVRLVHAQVYARKGFSSKTAVAVEDAVDTKPFTALDKYLVGAYFNAIGVSEYKDLHLNPNEADSDGDGLPDGWELYVMYGRTWDDLLGGVTKADSLRISPLDRADAMRLAPGEGSRLKLFEEYDAGFLPTDPWTLDSNGDGVSDYFDYHWGFKGDSAGKDFDGDGLSNYAEYLITEVFKYAQLDPRNPKTDGYCVDYFRKMGDLYFGEIFTDHDQVDDVWEAGFADVANRYVYDPGNDSDNDGWSNWAEQKAGTSPRSEYEPGIDDYILANYPIPRVEAFLSCDEVVDPAAKVVIRAWSQKSDPSMTGPADAEWVLGGETDKTGKDGEEKSGRSFSKYIGIKPSGVQVYNLGAGAIKPGSIRICFKDLSFSKVELNEFNENIPKEIGDPDEAEWYYMTIDRTTSDGKGVLYTTGGIAADEQKVGTVDYETGRLTVDFNGKYMTGLMLGDPSKVISSDNGGKTGSDEKNEYDLLNLDESYVVIVWESSGSVGVINRSIRLSDATTGHLREGLNTFLCYVSDDSGAFVPGQPFGVARDVDVGWAGAKLEIKLTETSAITPRINLWSDESDRVSTVDSALIGSALTDPLVKSALGTNAAAYAAYETILSNRTALVNPPDEGERTRIRVVRYGIDNMFCYRAGVYGDQYEQRTVLDREFNPNGRDFLCEADFLGEDMFDLDWTYLRDEVVNASGVAQAGLEVSNMTYLVVIGDGPTSFRGRWDTNTAVNALATMITRRFEVTRHLPVAENVEGIVYGARPTFRWAIPDEEPWAKAYGTSYTAFKLQILKTDGTTVVYDSGVKRLPPQAKDGSFTWTADAYAGDQTALGKIFGAAGDWTWRVAMYNAKFKPAASRSEKWSNVVPFSTSVGTQQETDDHNYSTIDVSVKYTGPAAVLAKCEDLTTTEGIVRIQAFTTADFSGEPVAQGFVTNKTALTDVADIRKNGTLIGLKPGTYYIRAYIDSNGNFKKDEFESWGAAKEPVEVKLNQLAPIVGLYIEDADIDKDWIPDAYEYVTPGYEIGRSDASVDPEGRIILKKEIYDGLTNGVAGISRFLSGASLTLFENFKAAGLLLGIGGETEKSTIDAIRRAVEKNIDPDSVKITSLTVDAANGKVVLTVGAKATDSIAGYLLSPIYTIPESTDVQIKVYRKANLATEAWGEPVKVVTVTITSTMDEQIEVELPGVDFNSGFYKVEIVK